MDDNRSTPFDPLDPMAVERIDVIDQPDGGAAVVITARGGREPRAMRFEERQAALAYVRDLWERRQQALRLRDET